MQVLTFEKFMFPSEGSASAKNSPDCKLENAHATDLVEVSLTENFHYYFELQESQEREREREIRRECSRNRFSQTLDC
jgi:hypothetical protein